MTSEALRTGEGDFARPLEDVAESTEHEARGRGRQGLIAAGFYATFTFTVGT